MRYISGKCEGNTDLFVWGHSIYIVHHVFCISLCFMRSEVGHRSLAEGVTQVQSLNVRMSYPQHEPSITHKTTTHQPERQNVLSSTRAVHDTQDNSTSTWTAERLILNTSRPWHTRQQHINLNGRTSYPQHEPSMTHKTTAHQPERQNVLSSTRAVHDTQDNSTSTWTAGFKKQKSTAFLRQNRHASWTSVNSFNREWVIKLQPCMTVLTRKVWLKEKAHGTNMQLY